MDNNFSNKAITFAAIFVSICALFVSIYQTRILSQQKDASVWPYVRYGPSYGENYFYVTVSNDGVGPAIIDEMKYIYNDSIFYYIDELGDYIIEEIKQDSILYDGGFTYSNLENQGRALKAGEAIKIINFLNADTEFLKAFRDKANEVTIRIKYCSIYKTCWLNVNNSIEQK